MISGKKTFKSSVFHLQLDISSKLVECGLGSDLIGTNFRYKSLWQFVSWKTNTIY